MVRWHALVVAKASGADTDLLNWIIKTTHLQKTVCGTPTHSHLCIITTCVLFSLCALRYCSMCTMSQLVAQQVCGESRYTQWRPFGSLDLWEVCGERHRCSTCTAFGAQLQISSVGDCQEQPDRQQTDRIDGIVQMQGHKAAKEAEALVNIVGGS